MVRLQMQHVTANLPFLGREYPPELTTLPRHQRAAGTSLHDCPRQLLTTSSSDSTISRIAFSGVTHLMNPPSTSTTPAAQKSHAKMGATKRDARDIATHLHTLR
jgi:hypothetical protein